MNDIRPQEVERLLVRGTNWVGDAIMSMPALVEIRRIFTRARISLLVRPWVQSIYQSADFIDEVLIFDRPGKHQGFRGMGNLRQSLSQADFQLAILLQNAFQAAWIAWWARIPQRVGYALDGRGIFLTHRLKVDPQIRTVHQVYYYLDLLSTLGLLPPRLWDRPDYRPTMRLAAQTQDRLSCRSILAGEGVTATEQVIGICPGAAYGSAKRWLPERFAKVADELVSRYQTRIVILGSASEGDVATEVARTMKHTPVDLTGKTTLGELMAVLERCMLLITNDSGPMHLAAALDVPQVSIFGSTSPTATGPRSNAAQVIHNPVSCSPCFLRECPIDFRCMTGIGVEAVLQAAHHGVLQGKRRQSGIQG